MDDLVAEALWASHLPSETTEQRRLLQQHAQRFKRAYAQSEPTVGSYEWSKICDRLVGVYEARLLLQVHPAPGVREFQPPLERKTAESLVRVRYAALLGKPRFCDWETVQRVAAELNEDPECLVSTSLWYERNLLAQEETLFSEKYEPLL